MKNTTILCILGLFLTSSACEDTFGEKFYTIFIDNNSSETVYFSVYYDDSEISYPDTSLPATDPLRRICNAAELW